MNIIMLYTSVSHLKTVKKKQEESRLMFYTNNVSVDEIDSSQQENKLLREKLFDICKKRYDYPQFFYKVAKHYVYIGDFETIYKKNEERELSHF